MWYCFMQSHQITLEDDTAINTIEWKKIVLKNNLHLLIIFKAPSVLQIMFLRYLWNILEMELKRLFRDKDTCRQSYK